MWTLTHVAVPGSDPTPCPFSLEPLIAAGFAATKPTPRRHFRYSNLLAEL